jgi:hypothetical protein
MTNPLLDYYRTKEIYVKLPTVGKWYKNNLNLTDQDEIGIMPMSFKDEMLLNVPDSIYNGESLFEIIKSIVPDMPDPYEICMPDVDVILLASRINANDGDVPVGASCSHCGTSETYNLKIINVLNQIKTIEPVEIELPNGLRIVFKPNTLRAVAANSIKITENSKLLQQLNFGDIVPEEKQLAFQQSLERATAANFVIISDTIESIHTPTGEVITDIENIVAWLANSDSNTINLLQKHGKKMNFNGINDKFTFECSSEECGKSFASVVEFNPTFFFTSK